MIIMMNYFPVTVIWRRQKLVKQNKKTRRKMPVQEFNSVLINKTKKIILFLTETKKSTE
jgi:hypothetical protein